MPRQRQEGNRFFSLDVDFFSDSKVKILKARYGADGITMYIYLLCEIYKAGYYLKVNDDFLFIVGDDLHMSSDKVKQVLTFLLERSMLDKQLFQSDAVLTSAGIQRRFQRMVKTRALKNPIIVEGYWLLSEEETETFIKVKPFLNNSENNDNNSRKNEGDSENNDTKEKEKKINNIYTAAPGDVFENRELEEAFQLFCVCRERNGDHLTPERVSVLRSELLQLGADDRERVAIANKAVASGWKSFYPLKKPAKPAGKRVAKKNQFHNFEQREYDYDALLRQINGGEQHESEN